MESRHISLVDWTKAILDDHKQMQNWTHSVLKISIFNPSDPSTMLVLEQFDEAKRLHANHQLDSARRAYNNTDVMARQADLHFLAALVCAERALTYYTDSRPDATIAAYKEAAELCQRSRAKWVSHMWEIRAKRDYASAILDPHAELQAAIERNLEQFELLKASLDLRTRRRFIENQLLGEREYDRAEYYSQQLLNDVLGSKFLGRQHWWSGVVLTMLVDAQLRQGKYQEVLENIEWGAPGLNEWCVEKTSPLRPYLDQLLCARRAALNPLP